MTEHQVQHLPAQNRFVLPVGAGEAKLAYVMRSPTVMDMTSTFVPSAARGQGSGAKLVEAALIHAREQGMQVIPSCWYVAEYIEKHPEFAGLVDGSGGDIGGRAPSCEIG